MRHPKFLLAGAGLAALACALASAQTEPMTPDVPAHFSQPDAQDDFVRREVMIPMRDGVKLFTEILIPKGAKSAPILLTRTPYNAAKRTRRNISTSIVSTVAESDELFVADGYIRVIQDVRGKQGSQGDYLMTRPARGPLNNTKIDHTTDAWDTIDWLVKNLPETNGKVGMIGSSYEGFTVVMALLDPHPALKVAAPESPMVDGWMGDDWFHYGAFRIPNLGYFIGQTAARGDGKTVPRSTADDYEEFLKAGSVGDYARAAGFDQLPWWHKLSEHPAYDSFWQAQALDKLIAATPLTVPTMWLQGLWDQEDMWGAVHCYPAWEPQDLHNDKNYLVLGPWRHSGVNYNGSTLGALHWNGDTSLQFRRDVLKPFFDQYLKDGAPKAKTPPVLVYNTGEDHWDRFDAWPLKPASGWTVKPTPLYLQGGFRLGFAAPAGKAAYDEYVSDPAKPIPFVPRPVHMDDANVWKPWLVSDQRPYSDRTDVLTYETGVLTEPLRVSGTPVAHLFAATSGTDSDWVVKLIDVYPGEVPSQPELGGYQLAISLDIFRGRYRESFEHPKALPPNEPLEFTFTLPQTNHVFLKGHRIMVQIQSSLFPLYDRNPQTYVENILFAKPGDYVKATQRVYRSGPEATYVSLPIATPTK